MLDCAAEIRNDGGALAVRGLADCVSVVICGQSRHRARRRPCGPSLSQIPQTRPPTSEPDASDIRTEALIPRAPCK